MIRYSRHRIQAVFLAVLVTVGASVGLGMTSAHADDVKYWSFWNGSTGDWQLSKKGAADVNLDDRSVIGWKYVATESAEAVPAEPQQKPNFEGLCPNLKDAEGAVRVAVVIDFGDKSLAPSGATVPGNQVDCVTVSTPATGMTATQMAATVGASSAGFVENINGYPGTGGTDLSTDDQGVPTEEHEGFDFSPFLLVAVCLILILIVVLIALVRMQRHKGEH